MASALALRVYMKVCLFKLTAFKHVQMPSDPTPRRPHDPAINVGVAPIDTNVARYKMPSFLCSIAALTWLFLRIQALCPLNGAWKPNFTWEDHCELFALGTWLEGLELRVFLSFPLLLEHAIVFRKNAGVRLRLEHYD
ncbi:hypothetical protein C8R45DRAFT_942538 [Mycena sanguinolenta]|nr:hypothetical protein C8R45DRAFT_942538 [Mycena sanguinolenta]